MVQRLLVQASFMRISRAGVDVNGAAEKDLLLSLGARSNQIIKSGTADNTSTSLNAQNVRTTTFNVPFPAQQSVPDVNVAIISNTFISNKFAANDITYTTNYSTSNFTVTVTGPQFPVPRLAYIVFRKQLTG